MKISILNIALSILLISNLTQAQVDVQQNGGMNYTAILVNGSAAAKFDIVFMGDGFMAGEQDLFNQKVDEAVAAIAARPPFNGIMCAFNIWRVNVISQESGIDHPIGAINRDNELSCTYGNNAPGNPERLITCPNTTNANEAANMAPGRDAIYILINDPLYGGGSGDIVTSYCGIDMPGVVTHELGHFVGNLADEYNEGYPGCYNWGEPMAVNATMQTNPALIKWKDLIPAGTTIPTVSNTPAGVVGLFEGAKYFPRCVYRPVFSCHMREIGSNMCPVCTRKLQEVLDVNCPLCERDPGNLICIIGSLGDRYRFRYIDPLYGIRWPFPVCLSCPPFRLKKDEVEIIIEGVDSKSMSFDIVNGDGKQVGRAESIGENQLSIKGASSADEPLYIQFNALEGLKTGSSVEFSMKATINEKPVRMR